MGPLYESYLEHVHDGVRRKNGISWSSVSDYLPHQLVRKLVGDQGHGVVGRLVRFATPGPVGGGGWSGRGGGGWSGRDSVDHEEDKYR